MKKTDVHDDWEQHWTAFDSAIAINPASAYRRRMILNYLREKTNASGNILDIGSGQGDFAADLALAFPLAWVRGLELSKKGVAISVKKAPQAEFIQIDLLSKKKFPSKLLQWANIAICAEVLEHLDEPKLFLTQVSKLLKPGATLLVTVPGGPRSAYEKYIGHRKHYTAQDLELLLTASGYKIQSLFKSGFPFFNLYKLTVILRGERILADISETKDHNLSLMAKLVMRGFSILFRANLRNSPWGWQLIAIAKNRLSTK